MSGQTDTGTPDAAAEQAAHWLARMLDPDCTTGERAAFERWRAASPRHALAYRRMERLWGEGDAVVRDDPAVNEAARRALAHRVPAEAPGRHWLPAAVFSLAAAVAIVAGSYHHFRPLTDAEDSPGTLYATAVGEQRELVLEDRSSVTLDTQTLLIERYSPGERRVDLRQGRAQFQVQGDSQRPFVVHTEAGTVTAVGTRFQVWQDPAGTQVTLLEGVVQVRAEAPGGDVRMVSLRAGEQVAIRPGGLLGVVRPANLKATRGWTEGKLFVDDWRLQDLVAEINRYGDIQLRIDDPSLRELVVSGVFRTHDRNNLTRVLEHGWGIRARPISSREVLLTRE